MNNNYMILNEVNLGISRMTLDKGALIIYDSAQSRVVNFNKPIY